MFYPRECRHTYISLRLGRVFYSQWNAISELSPHKKSLFLWVELSPPSWISDVLQTVTNHWWQNLSFQLVTTLSALVQWPNLSILLAREPSAIAYGAVWNRYLSEAELHSIGCGIEGDLLRYEQFNATGTFTTSMCDCCTLQSDATACHVWRSVSPL